MTPASDIAVVTMVIGDEYAKAVAPATENKRKYCEMHGYDFVIADTILDLSRPISWSKILLLSKLMQESSYKWLFWTDADSLIMNPAISVEDLIDEKYNLIIPGAIQKSELGKEAACVCVRRSRCRGSSTLVSWATEADTKATQSRRSISRFLNHERYITKAFNYINSGEFIIRNCEWGKAFLTDIYSHAECINDAIWENRAFILELKNKQEYHNKTKILPQRLINSYSEEVIGKDCPNALYSEGDFIIHFAREKVRLEPLIQAYSQRVVSDPDVSLDYYLEVFGFHLNPVGCIGGHEGYMTPAQRDQFRDCLKKTSSLRTIMEIGLNAGHSAESFFNVCPAIQKFVSFDINLRSYTATAVEYFKRKYRNRFVFIPGDSQITVPKYKTNFPSETFDLIYIDGGHFDDVCLNDIINSSRLAHPDTILWIDDNISDGTAWAIEKCVQNGIIEVLQEHQSNHESRFLKRSWIEARFLF